LKAIEGVELLQLT